MIELTERNFAARRRPAGKESSPARAGTLARDYATHLVHGLSVACAYRTLDGLSSR